MGEARRKNQLLDRLKAEQPHCIYCAGVGRTESVDHMPPIAMFSNRRRPKGLEFGACEPCNGGSRRCEQVASFFGRLYPDATSPEAKSEMTRIISAMKNNHSDLLAELRPAPRNATRVRGIQLAPLDGQAAYVGGPLVTAAMNSFSAKLGFALHYRISGTALGPSGGVAIRWYSNFDLVSGSYPQDFMEVLGPPHTLVQGRFEVRDQFLFSSAMTPDKQMSGHLATFRESFAVVAFAAHDVSDLRQAPAGNLFRPGFLRASEDASSQRSAI